jgi:lactoylglutathione lyase
VSFDHIAFQVSDMDSSISFYTQKLGFKFIVRYEDEEEHEEFALLKYGNAHLELIKDLKKEHQKPVINKPYCPHLAIEVDDMKSAFKTLKENNINIIQGPQKLKDEETWVYFSDPDNNILEYIQWHKKK